jgi:hypothetical protein
MSDSKLTIVRCSEEIDLPEMLKLLEDLGYSGLDSQSFTATWKQIRQNTDMGIQIVITHSHVKQRPDDIGGAVVHIFKFANNKVVELWDLGQPIAKDSPNENGPF